MRRTMSILSAGVLASLTTCVAWGQGLTGRIAPLSSALRPVQATPQGSPGAPQGAKKGPQWKSRAEYDAFQAILKAASPEAKVTAANAFLAKYPNSDFKAFADYVKFQSYMQLNNVHGATDAAKSALKNNPNSLVKVNTLHYLAYVFPYTYKSKDPDASTQLSEAQSQAQEGLQALQQLQKPPNVSEDQFEAQIKKFRADFNRALGFTSLEQKDSAGAINYLKAAEQDSPKDSYTTLFLGQAYLGSKPPDYNSALWYLARAVDLAKQGNALNLAAVQKLYDQWYEYRHGSNSGERSLLAQAGSSENPPSGFNVATPPKHAKTGNAGVDGYYSMQDALTVGGDEAESAWNGFKGQPFAVLGYVESVSPGSDTGTYDVKTDILPQSRGQGGIFQLDLITKQPDAKYLKLGDPMHFRGTITAYTMKPNFVLTISDVEIDPATLRMASERAKAAALKEQQRKQHH